MGHTAVSATQSSSVTVQIWHHGAKENYCDFATFNRIVDTQTIILPIRKYLRMSSILSVGKKHADQLCSKYTVDHQRLSFPCTDSANPNFQASSINWRPNNLFCAGSGQ